MRLPHLLSVLGLVALAGLVSTSGAPRASIDGVLPAFDIAESYIRSQTDGNAQSIGYNEVGDCSFKNPCVLGSCCNSDNHYFTLDTTWEYNNKTPRSVRLWAGALLTVKSQDVRRQLRC
jgi:hypothetical protein